jgi:four helix bundle protein
MSTELKERTKNFAINVVRLTSLIKPGKIEDIIKSQILRSATSVGANYRAALRGRSRAEFISKLNIAEEEADETCYC